MDELQAAIIEAAETLKAATGKDLHALFRDRFLDEPGALPSPEAQRAAGLVEGAAIALGLTVNELLDELSFDCDED
jgi:hypothetical protein